MKIGRKVFVLEAEAVGILKTLAWIKSKPEVRLVIEIDSLVATNAINGDSHYQLEVGHIFYECKGVVQSSKMISVHHVSRLANKVAHLLAQIPCECNNYLEICLLGGMCWFLTKE